MVHSGCTTRTKMGDHFTPFFACEAVTALHYPGNSFDWDTVQHLVNKPYIKSTYTCYSCATNAFESHTQWLPASGKPRQVPKSLLSIWATPQAASHVLAPCGHPMSLNPLLGVCWNTLPPALSLPWESCCCLRLFLHFPPQRGHFFCALPCTASNADLLLVDTHLCGVLLLTPEFSFEIKDSVTVQCFCATNLHLENCFEGKFVSSSWLWAPHLTRGHALPKELSQLCSNRMKWGRAEAGKEKCQVSLLVL